MKVTGANELMGLADGCFDGHCHVFRTDLPMLDNRRYTPVADAEPAQLIELLNAHGLRGAILVQPSFLGADNRYLLDALRRESGEVHFRGVVVLDPAEPPSATQLHEMADSGVIGVRLNLSQRERQFNYADWQAVLGATERLGWHVELYCAADYLAVILPVLLRHHARVVVDHYGMIESLQERRALDALLQARAGQLYVKLSAPYRIHTDCSAAQAVQRVADVKRFLLEHFDHSALLWGSDWPFTQFEQTVSYAQALAWRPA